MSHRRTHIKNKISRTTPKVYFFRKPIFWIVFLCLVIILGAVYFILFFKSFWVKDIIILGNEKISTEDIKNLVVTDIDKNITKSIFLTDVGDLRRKIIEKFPVIEKVVISKKYPKAIELGITERKPAGVYCDENEKCSLIDQNGVAFEGLEIIPEDMFVVRGSQVISKNIVDAITKIQKKLKEKFNIDVLDAMITTPIRLDVKTKENWQIYFNTENLSNIDLQMEKLSALLSSELIPEQRKTLEYIDLRFEKTYYK